VKNVELWQRLDAARAPHPGRLDLGEGPQRPRENERADQLARDEIDKLRSAGFQARS